MTTRHQLSLWEQRLHAAQRQIYRLQRTLDARRERWEAKRDAKFPGGRGAITPGSILAKAIELFRQQPSQPAPEDGHKIGSTLSIRLPTNYKMTPAE